MAVADEYNYMHLAKNICPVIKIGFLYQRQLINLSLIEEVSSQKLN